MEWLVLLRDENIMQFLADYTIAIGFFLTVAGVVVKMTKTQADDKLLEALKGKVKIIKK